MSEPSTEPAFAFSAVATLEVDDALITQLLLNPLAISVMEGGAVKSSCKLAYETWLTTPGMEPTWLPLTSPEGEAAGELLVGVEAGAPILTDDDYEEGGMLSVSLLKLQKLPSSMRGALRPQIPHQRWRKNAVLIHVVCSKRR